MAATVIFGATSAIAVEVARLFAGQQHELVLVARHAEKLQAVADDLTARGAARVETIVSDLSGWEKHEALLQEVAERVPDYHQVLIAHGVLSDQAACERSVSETMKQLDINFLSVVSLVTHIANRFESQKRGVIAVISSVAGDRGRKSNYVYGTAKAGVSAFLQGVRNRLHGSGVRVVTIKPGFVATPMTAHLTQGPLFASPDKVAKDIERSITSRGDVVYTPWFWRFIMVIIRLIPEPIFKRLSL